MHLKFNPYVGYTHCGAHLTCLETLFNGHYSSKIHTFSFVNIFIIKRTQKFSMM